MHEVNVDSIRVSLVNYQRVVILKDKTSGKSIPIWIGSSEADSIAVKLQGVSVPRPLTHDLMKSMIDLFNGELQCINVTDLEDETFFAQLVFNAKGKLLELDARPSDAIAIALRSNVPVTVNEEIFANNSIDLIIDKTNEIEEFKKFINDINPEDFS